MKGGWKMKKISTIGVIIAVILTLFIISPTVAGQVTLRFSE